MQEKLVNMPRTKRGRATLNNILSAAAQIIIITLAESRTDSASTSGRSRTRISR